MSGLLPHTMTSEEINHTSIVNISCLMCCLLFLAVLLIALLTKREKGNHIWSIAVIYIGEFLSMALSVMGRTIFMKRQILWTVPVNYSVSFAAIMLVVCGFYWYFLSLIEEKGGIHFSMKQRRFIVPFAFVTIVLFALSMWRGALLPAFVNFSIRQRYYYAINFITLPIVLITVIVLLRYRRLLRTRDLVIAMTYCLVPHIAGFYDYLNGTEYMHVTLTLISCFFYVSIALETEQELESKKKALTESQLYSLIQQINPHFIFNTLASIDSLCRTDPQEAQRLISKFSDYLWDNYTDMNQNPMIPFIKEKEHLDHYLAIEKVRFPRLNVEYDIKARNFQIPSLTVQPLAENAVKYGICRRRKSEGTLRISTYETESSYIVCVTDNGVGFDTGKLSENDAHIGIANVRKRLQILCNGTLDITSRINEGTICTVTLPKEGKNESIMRR